MRPACEPGDPGHCAVGLGASLDWRSCKKQPLPDPRNLLISVVQTNAGHKRGKGKRVTPPPATTPTALTHRCNLRPLWTKGARFFMMRERMRRKAQSMRKQNAVMEQLMAGILYLSFPLGRNTHHSASC